MGDSLLGRTGPMQRSGVPPWVTVPQEGWPLWEEVWGPPVGDSLLGRTATAGRGLGSPPWVCTTETLYTLR